MNDIDIMRTEFARTTQRGGGMLFAGCVYWTTMAFVGGAFSARSASLIYFAATGLVFPLGLLATRLLGGNLLARGPLSSLGLVLNAVQVFYWPVAIVVFRLNPELVPFTLGTLFASHFLGYGWLYRSPGYTALGIGGPILTVLMHVLVPDHAPLAIPAALAVAHVAALVAVINENILDQKRLLPSTHP